MPNVVMSAVARPGILTRVLRALGLQRVPAQSATRSAGWAGAQLSRLTTDWVTQPTSIDADVRSSGRRLRARARQLRRDNPLAARYVQLQSENIVGPHGIALQCRLPNTRNGTNEAASDAIEWAWYDWGRRENCTVDGRHCWTEVLALFAETWKTDGEALLVLHPGFPNRYGFAVQLLDADQVDDDYNVPPGDNRNEVRMGVEVDGWGRPVAYHVLSRHPGDWYQNGMRVRQRIPADRVIHRFTALGPGQTRGITPMAPVMLRLQMLAGSQEALIILQRTAACKMGFLTFDPEKGGMPLTPAEDVDGAAALAEKPPVVSWDAEPGRIEQLPVGFDFKEWNPGMPTQEYEALARSIVREIAMGLGVSYASLIGDLSQANFGSQRVSMTSERDGYQRDQQVVVEDCARVFAGFLTSASLKRVVRVPGSDIDACVRAAEWQPRGFDWIDPEKDIDAALKEVDAGVNTLTDIAARKGRDYADLLRKRQREIALAKELGVPVVTPQTARPEAAADPGAEATPPPARALALARHA